MGPSGIAAPGQALCQARSFVLISQCTQGDAAGCPGLQGRAVFFPCPHRGQCQDDFLYTHLPPFGTYVAHVGSDVCVVSVPGSRGQVHLTLEPSMSKLSGTLAIAHVPRRVGWRPRGRMTCSRSYKLAFPDSHPVVCSYIQLSFLLLHFSSSLEAETRSLNGSEL